MSEDGITLQMNEDGTWGLREEPYATIEVSTEEEYYELMEIIELGRKVKEEQKSKEVK